MHSFRRGGGGRLLHYKSKCARMCCLCFFFRLFVVKGNPDEVFPTLFKDWGITRLTFEIDTEPYSVTRDAEVEKIAASHGVEVIKRVSHTLYDVHK